jgi:hypothetical protein
MPGTGRWTRLIWRVDDAHKWWCRNAL